MEKSGSVAEEPPRGRERVGGVLRRRQEDPPQRGNRRLVAALADCRLGLSETMNARDLEEFGHSDQ